jgi:hypothetical protein
MVVRAPMPECARLMLIGAESAPQRGIEQIAAKAPQEASERVEPCAFAAI